MFSIFSTTMETINKIDLKIENKLHLLYLQDCFQLNLKIFFHCLRRQIKSWLFRLGCYFFSSWYFIDSDSICTTGKVLKVNSLYTYQENGLVEIVRLTNVHIERGYLYCSLFFTSKNRIITVRHTLQNGTNVLWRIMDNEEFDEIMSRNLWMAVDRPDELLEFDFENY